MAKSTLTPAQKKSQEFAVEAARLMEDRKCEDVRVLDVRGLSQVCDYLIVGSGTSDRQMRSIAHEMKALGREHDNEVFRTNADEEHTWIVVDFVEVVIHLFEPNQRGYYDLETLWSDAKEVSWKRNGTTKKASAKKTSKKKKE
ncbi:MAG TPA: ribosome silencing factor [Phycisphaerales bacterium]|nr:ribosome silencing factor [Phycisphaerales bacterium]